MKKQKQKQILHWDRLSCKTPFYYSHDEISKSEKQNKIIAILSSSING